MQFCDNVQKQFDMYAVRKYPNVANNFTIPHYSKTLKIGNSLKSVILRFERECIHSDYTKGIMLDLQMYNNKSANIWLL